MNKKRSKIFIGFWCQFFDQFAIKVLCNNNYDWIALDMEHGVYNFKDISILSDIIKSHNKLPFVRLNESNENNIQRSLDCGADGLILPMIEDPNKLISLVSKMKYPPSGTRSVGYTNSNKFGLNLREDIKIKSKPYLVIQIESLKGVENLKDLIKIKEVDAVMIGPYDLSASLGCPGDFKNKKFINCLKVVNQIIKKSSKLNGYHIVDPDPSELRQKIKLGYSFIAYGTDGSFIRSKLSYPG